jgi:hypothetical protein
MNKKERERDLRNDGFKKEGGVNYDTLMDRQIGDKRFERERANAGKSIIAPVNSTIDTLQRMAAGVEGRTIADKINDSNRPTWEQYKKDNESKLDLIGGEMRKMVEYRAQLDKERDQRLEHGTNRAKKSNAISDSDNSDDSSSSDSEDNGKHKKKHKKEKKSKSSKKSKKHKDKKDKKKRSKHSTDSNSDDENNNHDRRDGDRDSKKKQKTDNNSSSGGSYRLSDFMNGGGYSSGEN